MCVWTCVCVYVCACNTSSLESNTSSPELSSICSKAACSSADASFLLLTKFRLFDIFWCKNNNYMLVNKTLVQTRKNPKKPKDFQATILPSKQSTEKTMLNIILRP